MLKRNYGRTAFLKELQAAKNLSKVSMHFNKIRNSLRNIHFLCATKYSPPEVFDRRLISKCQRIYVMKFDDDVMKFIL